MPVGAVRLVCFDVAKRGDGPMALCSGGERGVICTSSWADVTCEACLTFPLAPGGLESAMRASALAKRCEGGHEPNGEDIASDGFCYGCHDARDREPEGPEIP